MCGRYASTRPAADLAAFFDAEDDTSGDAPPGDEIRPTDPVPIVHADGGRDRRVRVARWGLVQPWSTVRPENRPPDAERRGHGPVLFNARAETVPDKPAFREAFARGRCLVPADGWYEWHRAPELPKPRKCFMSPAAGDAPLAFAGLYRPATDRVPATCTIVTTAALGELACVHDRMPLLLDRSRWSEWLDCAGAPDRDLLDPPAAGTLAAIAIRPVGPAPEYTTPTLF